MRFDLTRPCGNCPFRSDKPFHMRPDRVREILGGEHGRAWWPTPSFPCHKTIEYGEDENGDEKITISATAQQCAGVMAILHRENRPNDTMQIAERLGLWNPATLDPAAPFYKSTEDAIRGQEMIFTSTYGIGKRMTEYQCPHCPRVERTRKLLRQHIADAHQPLRREALTHFDRAGISNRNRKLKVTLPGDKIVDRRIVKQLTDAQVRALAAVRDGLVMNVFTSEGNVFRGPSGIGPVLYRKLQAEHLIEDETKPVSGVIASTHKQRLTESGRLLLATLGEVT